MNSNLRSVAPAAPGGRHNQAVGLARTLARRGLSPEASFTELRPLYGPDFPDRELRGIVRWASTHAAPRDGQPRNSSLRRSDSSAPSRGTPDSALERLLGSFHCEESDFWEASPIRLPANWREDGDLLLSYLYKEGELINIVTDHSRRGVKYSPLGKGITQTRERWLEQMEKDGPPGSEAGAWIRMNPVDGLGVCDENVVAHRFLLVESDAIDLKTQIRFAGFLKLPLAAVISSGGRSLHLWIRIESPDPAHYRETAAAVFSRLQRFGVDCANRNPSRLARLPGVYRTMDGIRGGQQRLLYLNPSPGLGGIGLLAGQKATVNQ